MTTYNIVVLPGDGIGPEVTAQAVRALTAAAERGGFGVVTTDYPIGAAGVAEAGEAFPIATRHAVADANAVLLGAVGDPRLADAPESQRPEAGLLALRERLGVYANLRPVAVPPVLWEASPLRPAYLDGVDILIVRELTGGLYYGQPRGRVGDTAVNTLRYSVPEIERVARVAFRAAQERRRQVTSVDKANVLEVSRLWREVVSRIGVTEFPDVRLDHLYVDYAAMRLVSQPATFDVLLTENLFGDILSDEAAVLTGSLGVLPSASVGDGPGLFEPVHGSAPDIAGRDLANPLGAIASSAMLLRYGLHRPDAAAAIDAAVAAVLESGLRTADLVRPGEPFIGTKAMGDAVVERLLAPTHHSAAKGDGCRAT